MGVPAQPVSRSTLDKSLPFYKPQSPSLYNGVNGSLSRECLLRGLGALMHAE